MDGRQARTATFLVGTGDAGDTELRTATALATAARRRAMRFAVTGGALTAVGLAAHELLALASAAARDAERLGEGLMVPSDDARVVLGARGGDLEAALGGAIAHLCLRSTALAALQLHCADRVAPWAGPLANAALQHLRASEVGWSVLEAARVDLPEDVRAMLSGELMHTLGTVWRELRAQRAHAWVDEAAVLAARDVLADTAVPRLEALGFAAVRAWRNVDASIA